MSTLSLAVVAVSSVIAKMPARVWSRGMSRHASSTPPVTRSEIGFEPYNVPRGGRGENKLAGRANRGGGAHSKHL